MQEVATLMVQLQQFELSSSKLPDPRLWQPDSSELLSHPALTPAQWESIQTMACRIPTAIEWASLEAYQQSPGPNLESIAGLFQILVELLYKMVYVHALNQELNMTPILRSEMYELHDCIHKFSRYSYVATSKQQWCLSVKKVLLLDSIPF